MYTYKYIMRSENRISEVSKVIHRITKDTAGTGRRNTYDIEEFNSITEFVTTINNRDINPNYSGRDTRQDIESNPSWYGAKNFKQAQDWLFHGWNEKTGEIVAFKEKAKSMNIKKMITFRNDIVGFAPIVPLAIMGVPENMIQSTRKVIKTKVVDIIYDMGATCGINKNRMIEAGVKMTKLIISLENSGYRVNLRGMINFESTERGKASQTVLIRLKDANQPIDINKLMFPLFHTAMFRGIGFDYLERKPDIPYLSGYGTQIGSDLNKEQAQALIKRVIDKNALYLSYYIIDRMDSEEELYKEVTEVNRP